MQKDRSENATSDRTSGGKISVTHEITVLGEVECTITSGKISVTLLALVISKLTSDCIMGYDFWKALPAYKDIMARLNQDLDPVHAIQETAKRRLRNRIENDVLYPKSILDNEPDKSREDMVNALLTSYTDVFSKEALGCCPLVEHEIVLTK